MASFGCGAGVDILFFGAMASFYDFARYLLGFSYRNSCAYFAVCYVRMWQLLSFASFSRHCCYWFGAYLYDMLGFFIVGMGR